MIQSNKNFEFYRYISNYTSCLVNSAISPDEFQKANYSNTGQIWNLDEQCKFIFGPEAKYCASVNDFLKFILG